MLLTLALIERGDVSHSPLPTLSGNKRPEISAGRARLQWKVRHSSYAAGGRDDRFDPVQGRTRSQSVTAPSKASGRATISRDRAQSTDGHSSSTKEEGRGRCESDDYFSAAVAQGDDSRMKSSAQTWHAVRRQNHAVRDRVGLSMEDRDELDDWAESALGDQREGTLDDLDAFAAIDLFNRSSVDDEVDSFMQDAGDDFPCDRPRAESVSLKSQGKSTGLNELHSHLNKIRRRKTT